MTKRYIHWYGNLPDKKKLAVQFILQMAYWMFAWYIYKKFFPGETPLTIGQLLFHGIWMATWMTTLTNWKKVRSLFKRREINGKQG
jgi:hypothetical protein